MCTQGGYANIGLHICICISHICKPANIAGLHIGLQALISKTKDYSVLDYYSILHYSGFDASWVDQKYTQHHYTDIPSVPVCQLLLLFFIYIFFHIYIPVE